MESFGEDAFVRSVGLHDADRELALPLLGEGDEIAFRRPDGRRIAAVAEGDALGAAAAGRHDVDLLRAAAIRFEADAGAVGRVGRRGVDRRRIGQPGRLMRREVHRVEVRRFALRQRHDDRPAARREPRRKGHAGEIADRLALAGLDVHQEHARVLAAERHIGDVLRRRREARRHHEIVAACQVAHAGAVLVHDREPLAPVRRRARFVDEHDAGVEKAFFPRRLRKDRVGDDMGDAAQVVGVGHILLAGDLRAGIGVPHPKLRLQPPVAGLRDTAGHDVLGAGVAKRVHRRRDVGVADVLHVADRLEEDRALEVVDDDGGDLAAAVADEARHGDRDRLEVAAAAHVEFLRAAPPERHADDGSGREAGEKARRAAAGEANRHDVGPRRPEREGNTWVSSRPWRSGEPGSMKTVSAG